MLWPQWRFGSDELPLIPWRAGTVRPKGIVHSQAWSYSSVTENRELARQHAPPQRKHVSFQRLAVVRGSSPVLGPPVLTRFGHPALRVWDETKPNSQRGAKDGFSVKSARSFR
jgi:hypothetical protein